MRGRNDLSGARRCVCRSAGEPPDLDAVTRSEGVRLFVERATAVEPAFGSPSTTRRPSSRSVVASTAYRWRSSSRPRGSGHCRSKSIAAATQSIAFGLLVRGDRTALPRQQTLRALIDWSHDLLAGAGTRAVAAARRVRGGWTLPAAEAVRSPAGDASPCPTCSTCNHSSSTRSLVAMDATAVAIGCSIPSASMPRSISIDRRRSRRARAASRLLRRLRRGGAIARHSARTRPRGCRDSTSNVRTCSRRMPGATTPTRPPRRDSGSCPHSSPICSTAACSALRIGSPPRRSRGARAGRGRCARCRGLFDAGQVCFFMGHYGDAARLLEESLAVARELGDSRRIAQALQPLGMSCVGLGDLDAARGYLEEALALAPGAGRQAPGGRRAQRSVSCGVSKARSTWRSRHLQEALHARPRGRGSRGDRCHASEPGHGRHRTGAARRRRRRMLIDVIAIAGETGSKPAGQSALEVCAALATLCDDGRAPRAQSGPRRPGASKPESPAIRRTPRSSRRSWRRAASADASAFANA